MEHTEFVKALRNAADFFEARPELGVPYEADHLSFGFYGAVDGISLDSTRGLAAFVRIVGGKIEKEEDDSFYKLNAHKQGFSVRAVAYRSAVCEKVKVGTKVEPEHVIPAQEETIVPEREFPVYEWRCPSIMAPSAASGEAKE